MDKGVVISYDYGTHQGLIKPDRGRKFSFTQTNVEDYETPLAGDEVEFEDRGRYHYIVIKMNSEVRQQADMDRVMLQATRKSAWRIHDLRMMKAAYLAISTPENIAWIVYPDGRRFRAGIYEWAIKHARCHHIPIQYEFPLHPDT
jgi:hypothetical protein